VFGKRAGESAAEFAMEEHEPAAADGAEINAAVERLLGPMGRLHGESPYDLQSELQQVCTVHAPIIREEKGLQKGLERVLEVAERASRCGTGGPAGRAYNPGWHAAQDLQNMLINAEALFRWALERRESRGAHARSDYPSLDPRWGQCNLVVQKAGESMLVITVENPSIPYDLTEVLSQSFQRYTPEEM
jgi:succinate dehydrogenase / fumarate reductase flavoprotein subunit